MKLDAWTRPLTITSQHGEYVLTHKPDPRPEWNPARYDFTPADQFDVGGKYVTERTTRDGIDAPIVAVDWEASKERREKLAPSQLTRLVIHFRILLQSCARSSMRWKSSFPNSNPW